MADWRFASILILCFVAFSCGACIVEAAEGTAARFGFAQPADQGWGAPVRLPSIHEPIAAARVPWTGQKPVVVRAQGAIFKQRGGRQSEPLITLTQATESVEEEAHQQAREPRQAGGDGFAGGDDENGGDSAHESIGEQKREPNGGEDEGGEPKGEDWESKINEFVKFGGAIEVNAFWGEDFEGGTESDIVLDTAEIDFEIEVNDCTSGVLSLEYQDGEERAFETTIGDEQFVDRFNVKEAFITFGDIDVAPRYMVLGRIFVPFGLGTGDPVADTLGIADPLTIEIFETRGDVALVGWDNKTWNGAIYAMNGETNEFGGDEHIDQYGATCGYRVKGYGWGFDVDADYIRNVFESLGLREEFPGALEAEYAPGMAAHIKTHMQGFSVVAEWNSALDYTQFTQDNDNFDIRPSAWQLQLGYQFNYYPEMVEIGAEGSYVAINYSESKDLEGFFPEKRLILTYGEWLAEGLRLLIEYDHDWDYDPANNGTGEEIDVFQVQVTYEW